MAKRKTMRLLRSLAYNKYKPSVPFLRILPTDYCNLDCSYCWQRNNDKHMMSIDLFKQCVDRARFFKVGLVSILGGEPTIWPHLFEALEYCNIHHICTDITTNGTLLSESYLNKLSMAGLDLLNISVDGLTTTEASKKACLNKEGLLEAISCHLQKKTLRIRVNSVICKNNYTFIKDLLSLVREYDIPISLGYAMYKTESEFDKNIHFSRDDIGIVKEITEMLRDAKDSGVKLIDPLEYFESYERFLNGEEFWVCNYATRRGWINVDPYGFIRDCTKKFGRINYEFATLTSDQL
ncbi:MAG: radical SAM protein, partial [Candidatus Delongbacteria bacterium]|nr:radical SAM protein [Candidatus Delongbacteria bacterium]